MTIPELVAEARTQSEAAVGLVAELGAESITRTAIDAAFVDRKTRGELLARLHGPARATAR